MTGAAPGLLPASLDTAASVAAATAAAAAVAPEDLGAEAAAALLTEIARGGCIDTGSQPLVLTLMALGPEDISRLRIGQLGAAAVATLRLLREFFGVTFKLTPETRDPADIAKGAAAAAAAADKAAAAAAGSDDGEGSGDVGTDGDEEGRPAAGKRRREGRGAAAAVSAPVPAARPSAELTGGRSARSVVVSVLGIGYKNLAKRVT